MSFSSIILLILNHAEITKHEQKGENGLMIPV